MDAIRSSDPVHHDVLVVGAGHGGAQLASSLRSLGFAGSVALLGDEAHPPYERPALSKEYLAGDKTFERLLIRPGKFWEERRIALLPNRHVVSVRPDDHAVETADGEVIGYGTLVWAAGGTPRRMSCQGHDLSRIHVLRNLADVDVMRGELAHARRVVVIGGGYIGLEGAAVLSKLGKRVVVLEAQDRVLARVAGRALSDFYEAEHRAHGVAIRTGTAVQTIEGEDGRATGVRLDTGEVLPADMVIVGIGIVPAVAPLTRAGAVGGNGVDVDDHCRTSLPDVFAIGDCAAHASRYTNGRRMRIESVQNAVDQATAVSRCLVGQDAPYDALPWFWSNQYDLRLQTLGLSIDHDEALLRGDPATRSFSVIYRRAGTVIALDCVNRPRDFVQGKALIGADRTFDPAALADPDRALKDIAAA